jgi:hypothetical protein
MKDTHYPISDELANDMLDDDIDQLYCQLEQIEPPMFLVDSIMASVAHLPQAQSRVQEQSMTDDLASSLNDLGGILMRGLGVQLS